MIFMENFIYGKTLQYSERSFAEVEKLFVDSIENNEKTRDNFLLLTVATVSHLQVLWSVLERPWCATQQPWWSVITSNDDDNLWRWLWWPAKASELLYSRWYWRKVWGEWLTRLMLDGSWMESLGFLRSWINVDKSRTLSDTGRVVKL